MPLRHMRGLAKEEFYLSALFIMIIISSLIGEKLKWKKG
jgi:hypothetical protein